MYSGILQEKSGYNVVHCSIMQKINVKYNVCNVNVNNVYNVSNVYSVYNIINAYNVMFINYILYIM